MAFTDRLANRGSISTAEYEIEYSVLLLGANCEGEITQTAGDRKTHTISFWHKRAPIGTGTGAGEMNSTTNDLWGTPSEGDTLRFNTSQLGFFRNGESDGALYTNAVFRDCSAWYHFVIAVDTTQGTASNRIKMYINGVQQTDFSTETYPSQNSETKLMQNGQIFRIGAGHGGTTSADGQGYNAEFIIVDGAAKAASDFGEFDSDSGIWKPKEYTGDFNTGSGTNGAYYKFEGTAEGTGGSSTGLDSSGNSNNMNFENHKGGLTDTPTNNFCTLNLNDRRAGVSTVISKGALSYTSVAANYGDISMTMGVGAGKWYYEIKTVATGANATHWIFGIRDADAGENQNGDAGWGYSSTGTGKKQWGFHSSGYLFNNTDAAANAGGAQSDTQTGFNTSHNEVGNIFGIAIDMDNGKYWVGRNLGSTNTGNFRWYDDGSLNTNYGNPVTGAYPLANNLLTGTNGGATLLLPCFALYSGSGTGTAEFNFGSPPYTPTSGNADANGYGNFEHAVPTGYYALCTKNLAEFG